MAVRQGGFAGLGFHHRDAVGGGEGGQRGAGAGIMHPATGDDQRRFGGAQGGDRLGQFGAVWQRAAHPPDALGEEGLRVVIRFCLGVLAQSQRDRAAIGRVRQRGHGAGQGGEELFGAGDAVKIAADRAEAVIGGDGAIGEVFHLLQHRVWRAVGEDVARQQQHRQAVDMGDGGGGDHIGGAGANGGGAGHHAMAAGGFGVGNGGERHGLLVLAAKGGQRITGGVQSFPQAGDVAVAENGPDAGEDRLAIGIALGRQKSHQRLRGG